MRIQKPFAADKIFAHKRRIKQWLASGACGPVTFELDIINRCNQKCPACFGFYKGLDSSVMPLTRIKDVISQIASIGGRAVTFTGGGEPLLHPDILEAVKSAKKAGLDVAVISNGLGFTPDAADVILSNCVWTRISLDAATPETFKKTHGAGEAAFKTVLGNIAMLVERKKRAKSACTVGVGFLTCEASRGDIYEFAGLCGRLGADYAQYRPLLKRQGEAGINYSGTKALAEMSRAMRDFAGPGYRVLCSEHKYRRMEAGRVERAYRKCYGHNFAAVVGADSKMYLCCHMRGMPKYALGDLDSSSMEDIWKSRIRKLAAEQIDFSDCPPLCRCDSFNTILWEITNGTLPEKDWPAGIKWEHENFI